MPIFNPPTVDDVPRVLPSTRGPAYWLFRHYAQTRGRTVLKSAAGVYTTVDTPTVDECAAAAAVYLGGHQYVVSDAEAAALTSAGYGACLS